MKKYLLVGGAFLWLVLYIYTIVKLLEAIAATSP